MTPALAAYLRDLTTRCEQATKGPWRVSDQDDYLVISREGRIATTDFLADACLIAAVRTDLPTLDRLVRDAHAALERVSKLTREDHEFESCQEIAAEALARAEAMVKEGG